LDLSSVKYRRPLLGLIEHMPDCVPILFDRCITHSHSDHKHKDFHVKYLVVVDRNILLFVVDIRFSSHKLDGCGRSRWKRISLSNVASQCMYYERIVTLAAVRLDR